MDSHEIERSKDQTGMTKRPDAQLQASLVVLLRGLAEARQADASEKTYRLYAHHLASYDEQIVKEAIRLIALRKRDEGEKAFPELGSIVDEIIDIRIRQERERGTKQRMAEAEKWFWTWVEDQVISQGKTEQQILDEVRTPGYTGRKARAA